jgi:multiple sugar transport system ATP-binding protein
MTLSHRIVVLKDGIIQQIGTPDEIYTMPKNVFVAAFVGSPKINLLEGAIEDDKIKCNSLTFPLPHLTSKDASNKIVVGIRPEDILVGTANGIEANVVLIEPIGSQAIITLQMMDILLKAIIPVSQAIPSGKIKIGLDPARFHIFDKVTTLRLD